MMAETELEFMPGTIRLEIEYDRSLQLRRNESLDEPGPRPGLEWQVDGAARFVPFHPDDKPVLVIDLGLLPRYVHHAILRPGTVLLRVGHEFLNHHAARRGLGWWNQHIFGSAAFKAAVPPGGTSRRINAARLTGSQCSCESRVCTTDIA